MKELIVFFCLFSLSFQALSSPAAGSASEREYCKELLAHIYSEITLQNMDLSLRRLNTKMAAAFLAALENANKKGGFSLSREPELLSLLEGMKKIDADFGSYLNNSSPYLLYRMRSFLSLGANSPSPVSYSQAVAKWKKLQETNPELFKGLDKEYFLDEWDEASGGLLQSFSDLNLAEGDLKTQTEALARQYNRNYQDIIQGSQKKLSEAAAEATAQIDQFHEAFNRSAMDIFWRSLDGRQDVCGLEDINGLIAEDSLACPYVEPGLVKESLSNNLRAISQVLNADFINKGQQAPPKPMTKPLVAIPYQYENINYQGSYCERDPQLADTVVIHHSNTSNQYSPQDVHDLQVVMHENDRDSQGNPDPWYMIAYNYLVTAPYDGENGDEPKVFQGRPDRIRGAHAGGFVNLNQVDPGVRELVKSAEIKCGWNTDKDPLHTIDKENKQAEETFKSQLESGYVSANITSVGVLVVGNYAPDIMNGSVNPGGYPANGPARYPSDDALRASAKLICELKEGDYPNLRKITDHNYIRIKKALADGSRPNGTCCPGTVYRRMERLLELTKEECPAYNFVLDISPEDYLCSFIKSL